MPKTKPQSPFQLHQKKWEDCFRCDLSKRRGRVVLMRGSIPCDILFIGEAPGISEDALGVPFIGPAGKLLDRIVNSALPENVTRAFSNLVGCIPREEGGGKAEEPPDFAIRTCRERLNDLIILCNPSLLVRVGKLSTKHCPTPVTKKGYGIVDIIHPSAILRMDISQQGLAIQRTEVILRDAWQEAAKN